MSRTIAVQKGSEKATEATFTQQSPVRFEAAARPSPASATLSRPARLTPGRA